MVDIINKEGTGQAKLIKPMIDFYYENFYKPNYSEMVDIINKEEQGRQNL